MQMLTNKFSSMMLSQLVHTVIVVHFHSSLLGQVQLGNRVAQWAVVEELLDLN